MTTSILQRLRVQNLIDIQLYVIDFVKNNTFKIKAKTQMIHKVQRKVIFSPKNKIKSKSTLLLLSCTYRVAINIERKDD